VEKTCDIMAFRAHKKEIELSHHINSEVPVNLIGDPARLRQIFVNLLGNAVKFTVKGEVVLNVDFEDQEKREIFKGEDGRKNVRLLFSLRDTGIGIPENKRESIFESFTQVDSSTTREYGGTGLGLTICKRLVELMKGNIWVESEVGKGSVFQFAAEFGIGEKASRYIEPEEIEELDIRDLGTLVVDDTAANRLILSEFLTRWGAKVEEAKSGKEALSILRSSFEKEEPFELILLDCRMPEMGGFEVMEKINEEFPKGCVTVMMLSSDNRAGDFNRIEELGIGAYLVKPVKKDELKKAIIATLKKDKVGDREQVGKEKDKEKKEEKDKGESHLKILLVEDTEDNVLLIKAYLKNAPYELDIAENGKLAVDKFRAGDYDLVFMDMQMPVMDGFTAVEKIRELEKKEGRERTAIVALTAYAMKEEVERTLKVGCDAHLSKPIKKKELIEMIKAYE
jgi:CheY-like chemotaxis protein